MSDFEYAVCYRADNGHVIAVTTSTVWRPGVVSELAEYRMEEKNAGGDPERLFIGCRPVPVWHEEGETDPPVDVRERVTEYVCSQEPHPGIEFYGDGGCPECGYKPADVRERAYAETPERIEAIARALVDVQGYEWWNWPSHEDDARAALAALREIGGE